MFLAKLLKGSYSVKSSHECWMLTRALATISKEKKKDYKKCIICQNSEDKKGDHKLTSTEAGGNVITKASKSLKDDLLQGFRDVDITNIKYHVNTCYADYRKKKNN